MFWLCITLLVIGVLAILLELLMPGFDGFVSGIIGILALVASAIIAVLFIERAWVFVAINLAVLGVTTGIFYTFIKRKQLQGKIILADALAKPLPDVDYAGLLGKEGKTVTILRPYGEADFNGARVEVSSGGPIINPGQKVRVVDVQATKVLVSEINKN